MRFSFKIQNTINAQIVSLFWNLVESNSILLLNSLMVRLNQAFHCLRLTTDERALILMGFFNIDDLIDGESTTASITDSLRTNTMRSI